MSSRTSYYKLHKRDNRGMFDNEMYKKAPVVLLEIPNDGPAAAYFLLDQNKEEDYNEVGMMELGSSFVFPARAKKISAAEFKRMTA